MAVVGTSTYGTGQYVEWTGTTPNIRASHTFMARVKHSSTATNFYSLVGSFYDSTFQYYPDGSFLGRFDGGASNAMEWFRENDSFFGPTFDQYSGATCYGNTTTWYHVCLVYNASTQFIRCYIDGVYIGQVASATTKVSSSTSGSISTGATPGRIADFAFFDRALSDGEVASMAAYREPQVTSGLFLFWRLDSNANDSSGNGRNGSILGTTPTLSFSTADNPPQPETPILNLPDGDLVSASTLSAALTKRIAVAASTVSASTFTGALSVSTGGVSVSGDGASSSQLQAWMRPRWGRRFHQAVERWFSTGGPDITGPWTMMVWARVIAASSSSSNKPLMIRVTTTTAEVAVQTHLTSGLRILGNNDSAGSLASPDFAPTIGQWYHLAVTYDGTTVRGYRDGSEILSQSFDFGASAAIDYIATFASPSSSVVFEAASAKVWSAQLSEPEISSESLYHAPHYQLGALFGFWEMAWPAPLADSSGNGHNRGMQVAGATDAQSESPELLGSPFEEISGSAQSASSLTGSIVIDRALTGTQTTSTQLAAQLSQQQPLVGSAGSASALTSTLATNLALVSAAVTASQLSGSVSLVRALSGAGSAASSLSATLTALAKVAGTGITGSQLSVAQLAVLRELSAAAETASSLSAAIELARALNGTSTSASTLAGSIVLGTSLVGGSATASLLAATLAVVRPIVGSATSASALSGALAVVRPIAADASSASTLGGSLQVGLALAAAVTSATALSATLGVTRLIAGSQSTTSELAGVLGIAGEFAGFSRSASLLSGSLRLSVSLDSAAADSSALTAWLAVAQPLAAGTISASTLSGALVAGEETAVSGSATSASSLSGVSRLSLALAGESSSADSLSGTLTTSAGLAAGATSASTLSGALQRAIALSGDGSGASALSGALRTQRNLAATSSSSSGLSGTLTNFVQLIGIVGSATTLGAALSQTQPILGAAITGSQLRAVLTPDIAAPGDGGGVVVGNPRRTPYHGRRHLR